MACRFDNDNFGFVGFFNGGRLCLVRFIKTRACYTSVVAKSSSILFEVACPVGLFSPMHRLCIFLYFLFFDLILVLRARIKKKKEKKFNRFPKTQ